MRNYIPCWDKIGISKDRYMELLRFCRQYDEWKMRAASMIGIHGQQMDGQPHGSSVGDPVYAAVAKRSALLAKIEMVEDCAGTAGGGAWKKALIMNACRGVPHSKIPPEFMPTSFRSAFFAARKEFFLLLDERRM